MDARPKELTIVFADLAGFTALTEAHGDVEALDAACRLYSMAECALSRGMKVVKHIGDAVMLVGPECVEALETALKLADLVRGERLYPALRTGIHVGPTLERDGDYLGGTVNLAARVAGHAQAGQIVCTAQVVAAVPEAAPIVFKHLGDAVLKNIPRPIALFEARRVADGMGIAPECVIDPVCQMRLEPGRAASTTEMGGRVICFCSHDCAVKFAAEPWVFGHSGSSEQI